MPVAGVAGRARTFGREGRAARSNAHLVSSSLSLEIEGFIISALERIQVGTQIALGVDSLYRLASSGSVHTMHLSMDLMAPGAPTKPHPTVSSSLAHSLPRIV